MNGCVSVLVTLDKGVQTADGRGGVPAVGAPIDVIKVEICFGWRSATHRRRWNDDYATSWQKSSKRPEKDEPDEKDSKGNQRCVERFPPVVPEHSLSIIGYNKDAIFRSLVYHWRIASFGVFP